MDDPQRDFFISYTGVDRTWAEWIAWTLEDVGYSTLIQAWDFVGGSNFVTEMDRGAHAKRTIAVLTPTYLEAAYPRPEWGAAFASDPEGVKRRLAPVRVEVCRPTGLLASVTYIDLVGLDDADAQAELLAGLSARRKPSSPPAFPGAGSDTGTTAGDHPRFPGASADEPSAAPQATAPTSDQASGSSLSWARFGGVFLPIDELSVGSARAEIVATVDSTVAGDLDAMANSRFGGRPQVRLVHGDQVIEGRLGDLAKRMKGSSVVVTVSLEHTNDVRGRGSMRVSTAGLTPDDLVEIGLRHGLFGEPYPPQLLMMESLTDPGIDWAALNTELSATDHAAIDRARLVIAEGMLTAGQASRILSLDLGPLRSGARSVELTWAEPRVYSDREPSARTVAGDWHG